MTLSPAAERRLLTVVPPVLVGLLALPFILWQNSWWEWTTAFWLLQRQAAYVSAHGVPTLFLHTSAGAFYPLYIFYAGPTLSVLAYPAALFGAWPVFAASCVAALVAGYLGIWWTARNLGLSHRLAVLPALTFATTPYLLVDLYGRGSWAELLAVNAVPVLLGGLTALVWRPERGRVRPWLAIVGASAIVAGTHNLTVFFAAMALPLLVLALLPLAPAGIGLRGIAKRLGGGVAAAALGVGLTGLWLLPNLAFGSKTYIATTEVGGFLLKRSAHLNTIGSVLTPWPKSQTGAYLYVQPPVLTWAWALVALAVLLLSRRLPRRAGMAAAALLAVGVGLIVLIVRPTWWLHLPTILQAIQNPMRLIPFLAIAIALIAAVALVVLTDVRSRRALLMGLVAVVAIQFGIGLWITLHSQALAQWIDVPLKRHDQIHVQGEPQPFADPGLVPWKQFRVLFHPTGPRLAKKNIPLRVATGDRTTADRAWMSSRAPVGRAVETTIVWSELLRIEGDARLVGRSYRGLAVVRVTHTGSDGRWRATAQAQCTLCGSALKGDAPWQATAGSLLTVLSAAILAALAAAAAVRRRRDGGAAATGADVPSAPGRIHALTS